METVLLRCSKLHDSVIGANTVPLDDFACNMANRFSVSGQMALGRAGMAHIALLVGVYVPLQNKTLISLCSASLHMSTLSYWTDMRGMTKTMTLIRLGACPRLQTVSTLKTFQLHLGHQAFLVHINASTLHNRHLP